jgi:L-seryl-tRNA(Ser) seleniumtransferase
MAEAARSYCVLEVDRWTNERNQRDDRLAELLARLFGVEAGIVVNNNAGAVLLLFQTFAGGRQAVVSRGELVEIGGSFRVPSVMERQRQLSRWARRTTRHADYAGAIGPGLLVKCTRATASRALRRSPAGRLARRARSTDLRLRPGSGWSRAARCSR